ncbi:MAG: hypothetical protein GC201_06220 [Alphaproteobacteria bacterium]|nr:hypothetical protein [Alphaproteobacteria bacterium]
MKLNRTLGSVSVIALVTAAGISGARADNALFELSVDPGTLTPVPSVSITGSSSVLVVNDQNGTTASLDASNTGALVSLPAPPDPHDVAGGTITASLTDNSVFSLALGNAATDADLTTGGQANLNSSKVGNYIDLAMATGTGTTSAATVASVQSFLGGDVTAATSDGEINSYFEDLGAGSAVTVDGNSILADGGGNLAANTIEGQLNPALTSTELGQSVITNNPVGDDFVAGATVLVTNAQTNLLLDTASATVDGSRIGSLAVANDDTTALVGVDLGVSGNMIRARYTGSDAASAVTIGDSGTLDGSAGIGNDQFNAGLAAYTATVTDSTIEAGDTGAGLTISDMTGSSLTFQGNDVLASGTSNRASNALTLDGVSLDGSMASGDQVNSLSIASNEANVAADLFIQNVQNSSVDVDANNAGTLNVKAADQSGSTILAGDGDLTDSTDLGNSIGASAVGNTVANSIAINDATTVDGIVAINSAQQTSFFSDGKGGGTTARNTADLTGGMTVAVANGAADAATVAGTDVLVDGNNLYAEAIANSQSSTLTVTAGTVDFTAGGAFGKSLVTNDWTAQAGSAQAGFSVASGQLFSGGNGADQASADANVNTIIDVDLTKGGAGSVTDSALSVSGNLVNGLAVGNLSSENSADITATTFTATAAVSSAQVAQDQALIESTMAPSGTSIIDADATGLTITDSSFTVDNNQFLSRAWANLVDSSTNSLSVSAQTLGDDGTVKQPIGNMKNRTNGLSDSTARAGLAVYNDQLVEDLETSVVTATSTTDFVDLKVGSNSTLTNVDASVSGNTGATAATLNDATSSLTAEAKGTSDISAVLLNVQSVADANTNGSSAGVDVNQNDGDIRLIVDGNAAMTDSTFAADNNSLTATGRLNTADNTLSFTAQTLTVTPQENASRSVALGDSTVGSVLRSDIVVLNDQYFEQLADPGLSVTLDESDVFLIVDNATKDISNVNAHTSGNSLVARAQGNNASNSATIDAGSFDLSASLPGDAPGNGQVASVGSDQTAGINGDTQGISVTATDLDVLTRVTAGTVTGGDITVESNQIRAVANANSTSDVLSVHGESFESPAGSAPTVQLSDASGNDLNQDYYSFAVGSRQSNAVDASASVTGGSDITADLDAIGVAINDSSVSVSGNVAVAEASGNVAGNGALLHMDATNEATGAVASFQKSDGDIAISAGAHSIIQADAGNGTATPSLTGTSIDVTGNGVGALATANSTANTLVAEGTNIGSGSGAAPQIRADDSNSNGDIQIDSDFAVGSYQGDALGGSTETVSSTLDSTTIGAVTGAIVTGSVTVDNNLTLARATVDTAANTLTLDAGAASGDVNSASASIASQQLINAGSSVSAAANGQLIQADVFDPSPAGDGSAVLSVSGNDLQALATGGTVTNALAVTAGARLTGSVSAPSPTIADLSTTKDTKLNADYNVLNIQSGDFTATVTMGDVNDNTVQALAEEGLNADSLTVDNNVVQGAATGFDATNTLDIAAGASSDVTGQVVNVQGLTGTVSSTVDNTTVLGTVTGAVGGAADSSVSVSDNSVMATANGSQALNMLTTTAGATLQEASGAGASLTPDAGFAANQVANVTGAEYATLNYQYSTGGSVSAAINTAGVGVDDLSGTGGVNDSQVSVNGNEIVASATLNSATNGLTLSTGTFAHPSAAVANVQINSGSSVSASVDGASVGIGSAGGLIGATSDNSSLTMRGNSIGSSAVGNSAVNSLTGQ